jgi:hypothetical protein
MGLESLARGVSGTYVKRKRLQAFGSETPYIYNTLSTTQFEIHLFFQNATAINLASTLDFSEI